MTNEAIRFTLTVPADMAQCAEVLKREDFYDKPYAEMYRQLIKLGMEKLAEKAAKEKGQDRAS